MKKIISIYFPFLFKVLKIIKGIDYKFLLGLPRINEKDYIKEIFDFQKGNEIIYELLTNPHPVLITRFGSAELTVLLNGLFIENSKLSEWDFDRIKLGIFNVNGVFPPTQETLQKFYGLYAACLPNIDGLGVWYNYGENIFHKKYFKKAPLFNLESLEPFRFNNPWSRALKGKKVLVVLPFEKTISMQYLRKEKLFSNEFVLPDFLLRVYKPYNSYIDIPEVGKDWFFYLQKMKDEIKAIDFDIALVAAGPFGLPLASAIKDIGKKAVHVGGALQLLFGIKGNRWEERPEFLKYMNEYWVKPDESEVPNLGIKNKIDKGSYW
ncbi:MAG: hypothetical protein ABL929_12600 [Ferruginibacter sp.]|nr:hypothetical protein [Ferruginibacter sp.]